jgi:hypothetical protein
VPHDAPSFVYHPGKYHINPLNPLHFNVVDELVSLLGFWFIVFHKEKGIVCPQNCAKYLA